MRLVDTLEWRDGLAFVLIEGLVNDATVLDLNVGRLDVVLPCQGVLHPVLVITLQSRVRKCGTYSRYFATNLRVVLTGVGTTGLLAGSGRSDSLNGTLQQVTQLKSLNKVTSERRTSGEGKSLEGESPHTSSRSCSCP